MSIFKSLFNPYRQHRLRQFLLAALVLCTVLFVVHLCWFAYTVSDLKSAREEAAKAGLITDPAKVFPAPCPDAENAAMNYQTAYGLLTLRGMPYAPGRDAGKLDDRLKDMWALATPNKWIQAEPALREKAKAALMHEDFAQAWLLIAAGARQQRCVFPVDYSAGAAARLPQMELIRGLTFLGCVRAQILAEDGHSQQAADLIIDLLRMTQQQMEFTSNFNHIVAHSCRRKILETLRFLLEKNKLPGVDLSRVSTTLSVEDKLSGLIDVEVALIGNWGFRQADQGADFLRNSESDDEVPFKIISLFYCSWLATPLRRNDEAAYLRLMATCRKCIETGAPFPSKKINYLHPYTTVMWPFFDMYVAPWQESVRLRQVAQAAIDAHEGRAPIATPGISVSHSEDGWTIVPQMLPSEPGQKGHVPEPWFIPARQTP